VRKAISNDHEQVLLSSVIEASRRGATAEGGLVFKAHNSREFAVDVNRLIWSMSQWRQLSQQRKMYERSSGLKLNEFLTLCRAERKVS
jgi:hypothetical protein